MQPQGDVQLNAARLQADFLALARLGASGDGVDRPALSAAHLEARRWFLARAAAAGLETHVDGAGNHSAILRSTGAARTLLLGSHLDSVPHGGRYDGTLGVLAALEILRSVREAGIRLPVDLEAIDFTDEEGTLVGLLGSAALAGSLRAADLAAPRGGRAALEAGMARAGLDERGLLSAQRPAPTLAGYLELHIEQGPRLHALRAPGGLAPLGIVTTIVGIRSYWLHFEGQANHAGTTPMDARADAALGASALALGARELIMREFPDCAANVGRIELEPGAFNVVPGRARVALECRSADPTRLDALEQALLALARAQAQRFGLSLRVEPLHQARPVPLDARMQAVLAAAAEARGLAHIALPSGAGHDAQSLAPLTPSGMLFVASVGGISHEPREFSEWSDCVAGAQVLLDAALTLAGT